jgi:ATP-dependent Clp protease ATP-binding subunit ClpA
VLDRLSSPARRVVSLAQDEAQRLGHRHIGTEHLLLGILADGQSRSAQALVASGATLEGARQKVAEAVPVHDGGSGTGDLQFSDRAKRALDRAGRLSLRDHEEHVDTDHVLLSLLDVEGTAGQVLRGLGVDPAAVRVTLGSTADKVRSRPGTDDTPLSGRPSPRCGGCGSSLTGLAHRVVISRGEAYQSQRFVVAFCSSCGVVVGANAL